MSGSAENREKNITGSNDEEFVVPHMDVSCLMNSLAYQKVLDEPWNNIHNWNSLPPSHQNQIMQQFLLEANDVRAAMAISQNVYTNDSMRGEQRLEANIKSSQ
ncbi:hypothetical protein Ciccas_004371 [Cichlidogyrus casuarinus]|uniref:Uncharacterized protein n=1 Tax=Cichlidogyrus casuarinus TaxID=1844966 RepID=A0ABD2QBN3_9PLAT